VAVSLEDALGYLDLLSETNSAKIERAAVRWHGRLETEATFLSLAESQLALAALASLCAGERDAVDLLAAATAPARPTNGGAARPLTSRNGDSSSSPNGTPSRTRKVRKPGRLAQPQSVPKHTFTVHGRLYPTSTGRRAGASSRRKATKVTSIRKGAPNESMGIQGHYPQRRRSRIA